MASLGVWRSEGANTNGSLRGSHGKEENGRGKEGQGRGTGRGRRTGGEEMNDLRSTQKLLSSLEKRGVSLPSHSFLLVGKKKKCWLGKKEEEEEEEKRMLLPPSSHRSPTNFVPTSAKNEGRGRKISHSFHWVSIAV